MVINHDIMRNENILIVLQCIQEHGPIFRKDIKEITGLSWGSISSIVNELLEKNIIREKQSDLKNKGRNPGGLDIDVSQGCIIGIDINRAGITMILMDLKCNVNSSYYEKINSIDRDEVINQVYLMIDNIIDKLKSDNMKVFGIGVAMQGNVDRKNGISKYCPYFDNWENVPIQRLLEERYQCKVIVEHSPACMALYETWFGVAKGAENLLFIRIGAGIGLSMIIDGKMIDGCNGNAGELGHIVVEPNGELCSCGSYGCLETVASQTSILKYIVKEIRNGRESKISGFISAKQIDDIDMDAVYRACSMGDELCLEAMERMAFYLGIAISNVINLLNPELIVLGGSMVHYESLFIDKMKKVIEERAWPSSAKTILVSANKLNTASIGASINIIKEILSGGIK